MSFSELSSKVSQQIQRTKKEDSERDTHTYTYAYLFFLIIFSMPANYYLCIVYLSSLTS